MVAMVAMVATAMDCEESSLDVCTYLGLAERLSHKLVSLKIHKRAANTPGEMQLVRKALLGPRFFSLSAFD